MISSPSSSWSPFCGDFASLFGAQNFYCLRQLAKLETTEEHNKRKIKENGSEK